MVCLRKLSKPQTDRQTDDSVLEKLGFLLAGGVKNAINCNHIFSENHRSAGYRERKGRNLIITARGKCVKSGSLRGTYTYCLQLINNSIIDHIFCPR